MPRRLSARLVVLIAALAFGVAAVSAQTAPAAADCEAVAERDSGQAQQLAERVLAGTHLATADEIRARMCLAWTYVRTGANGRAEAELGRLLTAAERPEVEPELRTSALRRAGSIAYSVGQRGRAVELYMDAVNIAEEKGYIGERIILLSNMGVVLGEMSEHERAQRLYETALELVERSGQRQQEALLLNNYGSSLVSSDQAARALPMLERALALAEAAGSRVNVLQITFSLGRAYRQLGRLAEAEAKLLHALSYRHQTGVTASDPEVLLELAQVHRAQDRDPEALSGVEAAIALAKTGTDPRTERDGHLLLSQLHADAGRYQAALTAAQRYSELQESLMREQSLQRIAEFELRQRDLLKERELELLRRDNDIQALQLKADRRVRDIGAAALILIVLGGVATTVYLRRINRRLRRSNAIDDLTGLSNRRYLTKVLDWAGSRYASSARVGEQREGVLFLVDVDHFKRINDQFGHDSGDFALRAIGQRLRSVCRGDDRVGRWGGEEFLVIGQGMNQAAAASVAERLRNAVMRSPVRLPGGRQIEVAVSIGFAPWPFFAQLQGQSWHDAMRMADSGLYAAKAAGRNAWVGLWGEVAPAGGGIETIRADVATAQANGVVQVLASKTPVWHPRPTGSPYDDAAADAEDEDLSAQYDSATL